MQDRTTQSRIRTTKKSVLLLGARQVGKSTLMRSLAPDRIINLADEELHLAYAKDPGRIGRELRALKRPSVVLVDEVQRVPALLNTVQALIDENCGHKFLLTGSSARKLKRGGANLLPGRILFEHLDPLTYWELGDAFDLDRALTLGTLPGIFLDEESGADVLDSYATVYLREEIQAEALTRDLGSYARFLDFAAAASGQWVNYSKLASDTEIPKETIRRFLQILEDTLLVFRIPPYEARSTIRRVSQRDRFVFFDMGVRNALLGLHRRAQSSTELGGLFEQWLILQALFYSRAHKLAWRVSAYRTDGGAEVDFVIEAGRKTVAVECKLGKTVSAGQLSGLKAFLDIAPEGSRGMVVFQGSERQQLTDTIDAIPYREFLDNVLPDLG